MTDHVVFLLLGSGNGATFAALALALVLTYRSSGVVNFGAGAVALYTAFTYANLREGDLLVPFPGLPSRVRLADELPTGLAIAGALIIAGLLGAVLYAVVFRPLRTAPAVTKAVASLGVLITLQALLAERAGTRIVTVDSILPDGTVALGGVRVPGDRLWFAATVLVLALALSAWFRMTRFGLATRAVAETEKGALVTGLSPDRIALGNWVLSAVIAGLGGILISPIVPLSPSAYALFIVPALAAALVAGFSSVTTGVVVGLSIGMVQSEIGFLQARHDWLPRSGLAELVPLVLVLAFLIVRGRPLPERGAVVVRNLGRVPRPRNTTPFAVAGTAAAVVALMATSAHYRAGIIVSLIFGVLALSHVVVIGFAGQISLAQLSLAGASAFTLSRLTDQVGVPFPVAPLLAASAAVVVGIVVGLPALRVRGLPVAVVTLGLAVALETLWFRNPQVNGGLEGATVEQPSLFGIDLGVGVGKEYPRLPFGLLCLVVVLACALAVQWLRRSHLGAAMLAVRANERSAAAAGVNVERTKLLAFGISAFLAGLGGALLAYQQTVATPNSYAALTGFGLFAVVYLSGVTSVGGALLAGALATGGVFYTFMNRTFDVGGWYLVVQGIGFINVAIRRPEGLVDPLYRLADRRRSRPLTEVAARALRPAPATDRTEPVSPPPAGETLLFVDSVSVRFGAVSALNDVSLSVREGTIVGLIGPNGAGKTTLIDVITGFTPASGDVAFAGERLTGRPPHERVRRKLGRTFQGVDLYDDLSVNENIRVGQAALRAVRSRATTRRARVADRDLDALCEFLDLGEFKERPVRELSQGQRQLVSIARCLASNPRLVLLDEPAGGLDSSESRWLGERIRAIRDSGTTVVLVDHDMDLVLNVCDEVVVLDLGSVLASGTPSQIRDNPAVAAAYLGGAAAPSDAVVH